MRHIHMTANEARARGWQVDTTHYPWTAYKGPRFDPEETVTIHTPEYNGGVVQG